MNKKGERQYSVNAENKVVVARLARWHAPLDLSMAPLFMALALIPTVIVDLQSGPHGDGYLIKLFLVKLTALLLWLLILKFAQIAIARSKTKAINLFALGFLGSLIGAITGTYVHYISLSIGLPVDSTTFLRRVLSTALIGFSWLPVTVVSSSSFNRFIELSPVFESSDSSKLRQNFRFSGFYKSYIVKLNTNISSRLFSITNSLSQEISKLAPDPHSTLQNVEQIIKVIETQNLRDFSNELESKISLANKSSLKFKISRLSTFFSLTAEAIYLSFKSSPLNPRIFTYIVTICTFGIAIRRNQNPIATLEYGIFIGLLTFTLTFAIWFAWKLRVKYYVFVAIFLTLINIYAPATITHYFDNRGYAFAKIGSGQNFTLLWGSLIIVCLLLGHIGNASINAERNIFNFRKFNKLLSDIESEMIKDQENLINHKWAVHIHGKIQTRLSTTVLALRQALTSNDNDGVLKALSSLQFVLQEPTAGFTQVQRDIEDEVSSRFAPWDGLLESDIIIDPLLIESKNIPTKLIGEVVEEIISNSVRHGAASEIRLEIRKIGNKKLLIRAEDNAANPPQSSGMKRKGVGTSIFNAASDGRWSLRRDEKRAKTVFEMRMDTINTSN